MNLLEPILFNSHLDILYYSKNGYDLILCINGNIKRCIQKRRFIVKRVKEMA